MAIFASMNTAAYRRLWFGSALSSTARWALTMILAWVLQTATHSPFWAGAGVFALQGPVWIVTPLAGVLADRVSRARVLALSYALAGLACLGMAASIWLHRPSVPALLAGALLFGISFSFQSTNVSALLPTLVSKDMLANAVSLQTTARQGAEFAGPGLAGLLLVWLGAGWALFFCALLFAAALWQTAGLEAPASAASGPLRRRPAALFAELADGVRYARSHREIGGLIAFIGFHCTFTMAYNALLPAYVLSSLHGGSGVYGAIMTAVGLGSIVGTLALAAWDRPQRQGRLFLILAAASGLSLAAFDLGRTLAADLAIAVAVGLSQSCFMVLGQVFVQRRIDDAYRGRVSSLYTIVALGTMAAGNWFWGALGARLSPPLILAASGLAFAIGGPGALRFSQALRTGAQAQRPLPAPLAPANDA